MNTLLYIYYRLQAGYYLSKERKIRSRRDTMSRICQEHGCDICQHPEIYKQYHRMWIAEYNALKNHEQAWTKCMEYKFKT